MRKCLRIVLTILSFLTGISATATETVGGSVEMTQQELIQLEKKIDDARTPSERIMALLEWDALFGRAMSENDPELAKCYNRRAEKAVAEIAAYQGKQPRLWKFYSSGIIVKSGGVVRAFDLNCGCEHEICITRLRFSPEVIARLADVIDESYYTHAHTDHFGLELAQALVKRGKRIITCRDAIDKWLLDTAIDAETLGDDGAVRVFASFQRAGSIKLPNCAFVLKLAENSHLLVKGDIYTGSDVAELCNWIDKENLKITFAAVSPFALDLPDIISECRKRYNPVFIPVHEWEFTHRTPKMSGRATQTFADWYMTFPEEYKSGRARFLFWGESTCL